MITYITAFYLHLLVRSKPWVTPIHREEGWKYLYLHWHLSTNKEIHVCVCMYMHITHNIYIQFFFLFLHLHLWHMEVPRLGVKSELQLGPVPQPWQHWIINTLSHARDQNPYPHRGNIRSLLCRFTSGIPKYAYFYEWSYLCKDILTKWFILLISSQQMRDLGISCLADWFHW